MSANPISVHDQFLEALLTECLKPVKSGLEERYREISSLNGTIVDKRKNEQPDIHREYPIPGEKSPMKNDINEQTKATITRKIEQITPQKLNEDS